MDASLWLPALGLVVALINGPWIQFDPVGQAVQRLEQQGTPPPPGYSVTEAAPGSLKPSEIAHTDPENKTIEVDGHKMEQVYGTVGDELVAAVCSVLSHEYEHTEENGNPSVPPATGYNNDLCSHQGTYGQQIDRLCELIEQRQQAGKSTDGLCNMNRDLVNIHNGVPCVPQPPKKFPCNAC